MRFKSCAVALVTIATSVANAQVASHAPTAAMPAKKASAPATTPITQVTGKVVARVNGVELTDRDLVRVMVSMFPYAQQHNGFPKELEPEIRRGAMQMVIFEELLYQQAKRRKMTVSAARVSQSEASFRKSFSSKAEYDTFMNLEGIKSDEALRDKIRRSLLIDAMLKSEVAAKSRITDAQVRAYYNKNPNQFYRPESFHIQSISILPPNGAPDTLKEARKRADEAYKLAKNCKTYREFGLLAEKKSDDDFHVNYGDHKPQPRTQLPPEIVKVALSMKPGQVSGIIQLGNAYTIFRLVAHIPAGPIPYLEIKDKLKVDMENQKTEQVRSALGQTLRKDSKIEIL
jgi:parvulin-like peptidyl-prolyl isomerase